MAVVVVTTGVAATGNPGTSLVIAPSDPSAIQPGDLILVAVRQNPPSNGNYSNMSISGFTVMATVDFPDLGVFAWGTAWMRQRLLGKVATASEPSSYTITGIGAGSDGIIAHLVALRGVDLTGGLPSNIVTATDTTAGSTITIPAITIQQAGSLDVAIVSNSGNEENPSGLTNWGGGFAELLDTALNGDWMLGGVAIATRTTAGVQPETSVQPVGDAQWGTAIRLEVLASAASINTAVNESASAQEAFISLLTAAAAVGEAASAAESLSAALTHTASVTESASASDARSAAAQMIATLSESITASDAVSSGSGQVYGVSVAEPTAASDALSAALTAIAQFAESATSADQLSAIASLQATVSEADGALDALSSVATLNISVIETGSAADVISGTEGEHLPSGRWIVRIAGMNRTVIVRIAGMNRTVIVRSPNRTVH